MLIFVFCAVTLNTTALITISHIFAYKFKQLPATQPFLSIASLAITNTRRKLTGVAPIPSPTPAPRLSLSLRLLVGAGNRRRNDDLTEPSTIEPA
jgi:hypothetical protein